MTVKRGALLCLVSIGSVVLTLGLLEIGLDIAHAITRCRTPPPPASYNPSSEPMDDFWGSEPRSAVIHQPSAIPGLGYEMAPNRELRAGNGIAITTNRFGMRDSEPAEQKSNSPCRIAAIGDSYTLGLGVREEETYAKVLENLLRASRQAAQCPFEVLNFGVVGYSSLDESLVMKYRVVDFDPQVVVIGYVLNDPEIDPTAQTLHRYYAPHPWWRRFRVFRLPGEAKTNWDIYRLGGGDYYAYLHAPGEKNWQSVVDAFADIRQVAAQHHIKVLLVIFPELTVRFKGKPWSEYPYAAIHRQVAELAEKNGFDVLDLLPAFSEHPSQDVALPWTDDHPSPFGYAVAAQAIATKLLGQSAYFFAKEDQAAAATP
jgi:lysophospholipase L1-like esterase